MRGGHDGFAGAGLLLVGHAGLAAPGHGSSESPFIALVKHEALAEAEAGRGW
jgi:hypothetical protein